MFVDVCKAAEILPGSVIVSERLSELYQDDRQRDRGSRARLMCLKDGMRSGDLTQCMNERNWPLDLIRELRPPEGDGWLVSMGVLGDRPMTSSDLMMVASAAGIDGEPVGNVRCTWPIRRYSERNSEAGGLEWLEALRDRNGNSRGVVQPLLSALSKLLRAGRENGAKFYIEQITAVIAKDAKSKNTCLTPRLHADEYYGHRETAITSLFEQGWSKSGGTLFFPTCFMSAYPDGDAITPAHMAGERFAAIPVVHANSGDVCIYDGMLDANGRADPRLGLPHISGDVPGESSRLVILMNHFPPNCT